MAAAPRKQKITDVPNLYVKRDQRTGNLFCQYRDVQTKKFHGLGSNLEKAEKQARQLNAIISKHIIEQEAAAIINQDNSRGITVGAWIEEYLKGLQQALDSGEIKKNTHKQTKYVVGVIAKHHGQLKLGELGELGELDTLTISKFLKSFTSRGSNRMAQQVRSTLIDLFAEAIAAGHFPADRPNPAAVAKKPSSKVKRARLTLDVFKQALSWAMNNLEPYQWKAILLGVVTAQRLDDIRNVKFKDVRTMDGTEYLAVQQGKTGTKILIPM